MVTSSGSSLSGDRIVGDLEDVQGEADGESEPEAVHYPIVAEGRQRAAGKARERYPGNLDNPAKPSLEQETLEEREDPKSRQPPLGDC